MNSANAPLNTAAQEDAREQARLALHRVGPSPDITQIRRACEKGKRYAEGLGVLCCCAVVLIVLLNR